MHDPARRWCGHADHSRTITVIGEGQIQTEPDVAKANVGVRVTATTVRKATSKNRTRMVAVLDALKRAGVAKVDMQTSNYSIHYEPPRPEPTPRDRAGVKATEGRYHVSNMVAVTIRDMDKVDSVLEAVTEAGANQIWGVRFSVDKPEDLASEARRLAAAQAREKAEELAGLHNVRLGPVVSISEAIGPGPAPVARAHMEMARGGSIVPGEVSFTVRLQVTYGIVDYGFPGVRHPGHELDEEYPRRRPSGAPTPGPWGGTFRLCGWFSGFPPGG